MSLLTDWKNRELGSFGGAWLNRDRSMISTQGAIEARNVEYMTGSVGTRHGFQAIDALWGSINVNNIVELYEWLAPFSEIDPASYADNALVVAWIPGGPSTGAFDQVWLTVLNLNTTKTNGRMGSLVPPKGSPLDEPLTMAGCTLLGVGMNLFSAIFDSRQRAFTVASASRMVNDPAFPGNPKLVTVGWGGAFPGPSTYHPSIGFTGGGLIGLGSRRFGYLIEYSTGFTTRVSPDFGTTAIPTIATFGPTTAAYGGSDGKATMNFATGWAAGGLLPGIVAISVVMTTATNLAQFYVVPGSRTLNDGVTAVNITVNITDADLSSTGTDATPYLYWMTQSADNANEPTGLVPFGCRHIALWADRMAYLASVPDNQGNLIDALYVSERNNPQAITADQHVLQLPGQRTITTMFRMVSVNYILGPHEIWGVGDSGDVPVTWAAPAMVDGRHGTLAIHGAEVAPSGDRAWIADQAGLFLFTGGPILDLPLSYYQTPDWVRINWGAAYCVRIKDDSGSRRVCITVPLDGATHATHVMTWDYTDGLTPETVRYSLNYILLPDGTTQPIGGMELMRNDLLNQGENLGRVELWLGLWQNNTLPGNSYILRHMSEADANPFRDIAYGIDSKWSGPPLPGRDLGQSIIQHHHGFHARLRGVGTVTPVIWDIDKKNSYPCRPVTLSEAPDEDELILADIINELAYVTLETKLPDNYFRLAFLRWYYNNFVMQR